MDDDGNWWARPSVAGILGCGIDDLSILSDRHGPDGRQVRYGDADGTFVASLTWSGILLLDQTDGTHWEVVLKLADGSFHHPAPDGLRAKAIVP